LAVKTSAEVVAMRHTASVRRVTKESIVADG
jgi:hypothetical protein